MKTLVVGMGNPIVTDDAIGVRLAEALAARLRERPDVTVVPECSVGGLNLLDVLSGYDRVVVLDSIKTRDARPGDWHHFTAEALRETMNLANVHDANFATALALGRRLGLPLPSDDQIHVIAVEIVENLTFGEDLSPELARRLPEITAGVARAVAAILDAAPAES